MGAYTQNPYKYIADIVNAKGSYETTKANGGTGYEQYHQNALSSYDWLNNNGYADVAKELQNSNYNQGLAIQNRYNPNEGNVYTNQYTELINALSQNMLNYGDYSYDKPAPVYNNRYDAQINSLLNGINNYGPFEYDASTDPLYAQYRKEYTREGRRATNDAIGAASAATGGIPSSYAVNAATQAGDYYASQMTDKIPELYQIAYNKYLQEFSQELQKLQATQSAEQYDYQKYLTDLGQYNTDRDFDYNVWQNGYNKLANNLSSIVSLSDTEYSRYADQLARDTQANANAWNEAQAKAQYGDLSGLQALGVDTSNYDPNAIGFDDQLALAKAAASIGDYRALSDMLGYDVTPAEKVSSGGGGSGRVSGGGNDSGSGADTNQAYDYLYDRATDMETMVVQYDTYDEYINELMDACAEYGIDFDDLKKDLDKLAKAEGLTGTAALRKWFEEVKAKHKEMYAGDGNGNKHYTPDPNSKEATGPAVEKGFKNINTRTLV